MTNKNGETDPVGCLFGTVMLAGILGLVFSICKYGIYDGGYEKGVKEITSKSIYQKNIEGKNYLKQGDATYVQINDSTYIPFKEFQSQKLDSLNAQRKNIENKFKKENYKKEK